LPSFEERLIVLSRIQPRTYCIQRTTMADLGLQGRKTFKVFNQDFIVDERYVVTKELGQGAYGIVWFVYHSYLKSRRLAQMDSDMCLTTAQRRTNKRMKALRSKRSQMFSVKRSWRSAHCERSSCFSTSEGIATYIHRHRPQRAQLTRTDNMSL
jgi:hypothetical protein